MPPQLVVVVGADKGKLVAVSPSQPLILGRDRNATLQLTDPRVSRSHCQLTLADGRVTLEDLASAGGTFVNGRRITQQTLGDGDIVQVGETQLRFECRDPAEPENTPAPPSAAENLPANRLGELSGSTLTHYAVGPVLARGQSSLVFRARDLKQPREVALKVFWPEFSRDKEEVQRFIRAVQTLLPLRHVNLVTTYRAGKTGSYCWVAMEYVQGDSLAEVIRRLGTGGVLSWKPALEIALQISRALTFIHHHGVIHRNITPDNILVCHTDRLVKLANLMAAKALEGKLAQDITQPGQIIGDVRFMSPERTGGDSSLVDARSDLYSLGATLYTLLAGRPPLEGKSPLETLLKIRREQPQPLRQLQPSLPVAVEATVMRLLAKRPEDRFQTAAQVLTHARALLGPEQ